MRIKVLNNRQNFFKFPMTDAELNLEMRRLGIKETVPMCKIVDVLEESPERGDCKHG